MSLNDHAKNRGFSLVELGLALAIFSTVFLVIGNLFTSTSRMVTETDVRVRADVTLRFAMDSIETSLLNTNYFDVATSTEVRFSADLTTDPNYQPNADFDGDGILNINDPDDDNDATLIVPPTTQWRIGYDLKDDDDNNDGQIDMRWRIYLSTQQKTLCRDYSRNGEPWGNHVVELIAKITTTTLFTFSGSKDDLLCQGGANLDTNNDGIISAGEMDAIANGGNGNNMLDTLTERNRIVTIGISINQDVNNDGAVDSHLNTEVMPPCLYIKRRP